MAVPAQSSPVRWALRNRLSAERGCSNDDNTAAAAVPAVPPSLSVVSDTAAPRIPAGLCGRSYDADAPWATVLPPFRTLTLSCPIVMADVHSAMSAAASPSSYPTARTVGAIGSGCGTAGCRGTSRGVERPATSDLAKKASTTWRR